MGTEVVRVAVARLVAFPEGFVPVTVDRSRRRIYRTIDEPAGDVRLGTDAVESPGGVIDVA